MGLQIKTGDIFQFYRYVPSIPAAIVFICLFSITTIWHIYQLFRTRTWILLPLIIGGLSECGAYIVRILSSNEAPNYSVSLFIGSNSMSLLAPVLFAATIYMCLGRIICATDGQHLSLIPPKLLTIIFVVGDITGLVVQGAGFVVMPLGGLQNFHTGENIVIGGLALLVISFGLFVSIAVVFDYRIRKAPTPRSLSTKLDWRRDLKGLYLTSILIFIRSIFRLVEYIQGNNGWLQTHEWTLYVLDATLMWAVLVIFNIVHPSHVRALLHGGKYSANGGLKILETKMDELPSDSEMAKVNGL